MCRVGILFAIGIIASCSTFTSADDPQPTPTDGVDAATPEAGRVVVDDAGTGGPDSAAVDGAPPRDWLYVFVSSTEHPGLFPPPASGGSAVNGFAGAAAYCRDLGDASKFPQLRGLRWSAWLSGSNQNEAWRRLPLSAPGAQTLDRSYRLRDGVTEVFAKGLVFGTTASPDGSTIATSPKNSIVLDEQNDGARVDLAVWSGTAFDMTTHPFHCADWNGVTDSLVMNGLLGSTKDNALWSQSRELGAVPCTEQHHVYCFEVP